MSRTFSSRGTVRRRELAIRSAIGASSRAVVQQLVAESMVLGVCGGLLGLGLTALLLRTFTLLVPADLLPTEADIALSLPVLAFSAVAAGTCTLICGLIPAWHLTRGDVYEPLRQDGRTATPSSHRIRHVLAASQCALAVVLLSAGMPDHRPSVEPQPGRSWVPHRGRPDVLLADEHRAVGVGGPGGALLRRPARSPSSGPASAISLGVGGCAGARHGTGDSVHRCERPIPPRQGGVQCGDFAAVLRDARYSIAPRPAPQ